MAELGRAHCPSPSLLFFHPLLVSSSRVISSSTLPTASKYTLCHINIVFDSYDGSILALANAATGRQSAAGSSRTTIYALVGILLRGYILLGSFHSASAYDYDYYDYSFGARPTHSEPNASSHI
eukprot:COSAG06_NODE_4492_length_4207_cov_249.023612_2_plen_124_part_00